MRAKLFTAICPVLCFALLTGSEQRVNAQPHGGHVITVGDGRPDLNFVGQFISVTTTSPATSHQYGYLSKIEGIDNVFNSSTVKDETTAMFTFSTYATDTQLVANGPLRSRNRKGTTTIYFHPEGGANFADPSSFEVGIPIQVSDYDQQVMIDPSVAFPFESINLNTVTSTESFVLNGELLRLGREHDAYRTQFFAYLNLGTNPQTGYFIGNAVGVRCDFDKR